MSYEHPLIQTVVSVVPPCSFVGGYHHFRGTYCLPPKWWLTANKTVQCPSKEDNLNSDGHENLNLTHLQCMQIFDAFFYVSVQENYWNL
jgi:hypothetical protein